MQVVILGAGGHGQVVAEILLHSSSKRRRQPELKGFLDEDPSLHEKIILGLPVLGTLDDLVRISHDAVVVAVGDNARRRGVFLRLFENGKRFVSAVHLSAVLAPSVQRGEGLVVMAGAIVNTAAWIGDNAILNTGCSVDHHCRINSHAHIGPGVHLAGNVTIGEGTLLGVGCSVIPGVTIGEWSIVGAGSVVLEDVPPHVTVAGVPARILRHHRDEPLVEKK